MKKIKIWQILFLLFLITATGYILTQGPSYQNKSGKIFGTYYNIIYQHAEELTPHIESVLQAVDNSLSPFNKQSIIRIEEFYLSETEDYCPKVWSPPRKKVVWRSMVFTIVLYRVKT